MTDDSKLPVALTELASRLVDKLPLSSLKQLDELGADKLKLRRFKNLVAIVEEAASFAESRGISPSQTKALAMRVGLPFVEAASLCEDDSLRKKWAELLLSLATEEQPEYSAGATYVRILAELDPWDCKALDYMVKEGGLSKSLVRQISFWDELIEAVPDPSGDAGRTVLSIEKLVRCGCLDRNDTHVSRNDLGITMYGGIASYVSLTVTGLKFHIAVTGSEPGWLRKDDEFRDDIHPVNPLPLDHRKDMSSIAEQDRFVRLVEEFDPIHYHLLGESKRDIRTVRDTIRSIDGEPMAAVKLEGRNAHPVKPGLKAWQELYENGLVNIADPETIMSEKAYESGSLTPLGFRFLRFIGERNPPAPDLVRQSAP